MTRPGAVNLTHFGGHLILAEGQRKKSSHGSALEVPGAVPTRSGPDGPGHRRLSASVARRLGVNETTLRNWVREHLAEQARSADPLAVSPSEFEESPPVAPRGERTEDGKGDPARGSGLFRAGDDLVCRFRFVAEHRHAYGVKRLC